MLAVMELVFTIVKVYSTHKYEYTDIFAHARTIAKYIQTAHTILYIRALYTICVGLRYMYICMWPQPLKSFMYTHTYALVL